MLNAPTRRAVLRRQRQRDLSLWTPFLACAASGLTQTAPEGLVPLDSLSRLRGERSYADSARGTRPSGLPFSPARRAVLRRQRQRDLSLWTPFLACAASGLAQTAPKGLVPLDSPSRLRAGRGLDMFAHWCCFVPPKGRRDEKAAAAKISAHEYNL